MYWRHHSFVCTKTELANEADVPAHGQWLRRHDSNRFEVISQFVLHVMFEGSLMIRRPRVLSAYLKQQQHIVALCSYKLILYS